MPSEITFEDILKNTENENKKIQIWAKENKCSGMIVGIRVDSKWHAYIVEDNYTVTPICNHNGDFTIIDIIDGGEEC